MYDIILKNANIIKGNLDPTYVGDICIKEGKIDKIGKCINTKANNIIDCTGLYVSPGFIDSHSHDDLAFGNEFTELGKISQGITTVVTGHCGMSKATIKKEKVDLICKNISVLAPVDINELEKYTSYKKYREALEKKKHRLNYKLLIGHGTVRMSVMGVEERDPTIDELNEMKEIVREAMENGASGMSTGLIYPPGVYSTKNEIVELLKVVKKYNGFYSTHMRNESDKVVEAVEEAISTAKEAGVPLIISHHKIAGKKNWGLSRKTLKIINESIENGMNITLDQYPYSSGASNLYMVLPPHMYKGGVSKMVERIKDKKVRDEAIKEILNPTYEWDNFYQNCDGFDNILIADALKTKHVQGKTVKEYAKLIRKDEFEAYFDLLIKNEGEVVAFYTAMGEEDIERIIKYPHTIIGTDGVTFNKNTLSHPRGVGSFTRVIKKYVKEKNILTLNEAIYKMTALSAKRCQIKNKGQITKGYDADLVVFNLETIEDRASYKDSHSLSEGIELVIINGEIAYRNKQLIGEHKGKII